MTITAQDQILEVTGVSRSFPDGAGGRVQAVDDVSIGFATGEVTAILGPNGAGKTTLLDLILGLNEPETGHIRLAGTTPEHAVRQGRVGALLQTGGLLPDLTVRETITMVGSLHRHALEVDEALQIAGLTGIASRRVGKCSGGQQQRLKFALALLPEPELIVLDEPTAGMDVSARHEFWAQMSRQADAGRTILFATHYLEEAEQFARRTVLMGHGRIIADGPTDEVRARAGAAHVSVLWDPTPEELDALAPVQVSERAGERIVFRTDDADALARHLLTRTAARGLGVRPASLEEAFMMLTEGGSAR